MPCSCWSVEGVVPAEIEDAQFDEVEAQVVAVVAVLVKAWKESAQEWMWRLLDLPFHLKSESEKQ